MTATLPARPQTLKPSTFRLELEMTTTVRLAVPLPFRVGPRGESQFVADCSGDPLIPAGGAR